MIEKNLSCCYHSTEVELCDHPSIHITKLLMVKYFLKQHSLILLSHLASLFTKVEVFFLMVIRSNSATSFELIEVCDVS